MTVDIEALRALEAKRPDMADMLRFEAVQIRGTVYVEETQLRGVVQAALALNAPFRLAFPAMADEVERLREALDSIRIYGTDMLSGFVDAPDHRQWQREAVVEITRRAHAALGEPR